MMIDVCAHIFCYADMAHGITTIGCQAYSDGPIGSINVKIFGRGHTNGSIFRKYHNTVMTFAQSYFILSANHPFTYLSSYFCFLNGKWLSGCWVYGGAYRCYYYMLTRSHIWGSAHNGYDLAIA